jgi:hypothetical protein
MTKSIKTLYETLKLYPDLNGFEEWMDKKTDYQWIRCQMVSLPLCVDYNAR